MNLANRSTVTENSEKAAKVMKMTQERVMEKRVYSGCPHHCVFAIGNTFKKEHQQEMMLHPNTTHSNHSSSFALVRIPGTKALHIWISVPLVLMYMITLLGNSALVFIIKTEESLHKPMYIFLCMLAVTDIGLSLATMPTVLGAIWFELQEIAEDACLLQMFFIHAFSVMESSVLLAMAFDRFVAICIPLRYSSILTIKLITTIGIMIVIRGTIILLPIPILVKNFPKCRPAVLSHPFCLHPDLMKEICPASPANSAYSLFAVLSTMGLDAMFILLSYIMILKTVFGFASAEEQLKSFNACATHMCVVLVFYSPMIAVSMVHRYGHHVSPILQILLTFIHFLLPPTVNPIVYGIKTKQIQLGLVHKTVLMYLMYA
ncbi:olfactory receptor 51G2-like [Ambystoma mexicanum]|uniref:olfactory receptor 51G2-like n=1 Tax=Ambystoma mexicanum TaxID=8296 RepID=UPI0037E81F5F